MPSASTHSTACYVFLSQPPLSVFRSTVPVIWLLLMFNAMITSATRQCYYPNGQAAQNATPCYSSLQPGEHSPCCRHPGADSVCLTQTSSGVCLNRYATDSRAVLYVGGCTDPHMQDDACPSYCKSVGLGESSVYAVVPCSDGTWCCSAAASDGIGDTSCCSNADQTFRLDWGTIFPSKDDATHERPSQPRPTTQKLDQRDATNSITTTSSTTSALTTTGILLASADDADGGGDANGKKCPPDRSAVVGLSTGVPLGVCLLAALAAIFVLLGRDRKARERIRALTEAAREERERVAREHMVPRVYYGAYTHPSSSTKTVARLSSHHLHPDGGAVMTARGAPPHTPEGQQTGFEGFDGYVEEGGLVHGDDGGQQGGFRHVSWATSVGGAAGTHASWTTGGESSSWAYEYDNDQQGSRKERFEMTP